MTCAARYTVRLIALMALAGLGFLGGSVVRARWFDAPTSPAPAAALALDSFSQLTAGPPDAPVTVRIFGDYRCPTCRQLERTLGDTLLALARTGYIRLVYVHHPLIPDRDARATAASIGCVRDANLRWSMHRRLYGQDSILSNGSARSPGERAIELLGEQPAAVACASSDSALQRADYAIVAARAVGFHEVPTVIVNGRHVRFRTFPGLLRYIERAGTRNPL